MPNLTEGNRPWGPLLGLMTGCIVAVVGIVRGLDPEIILWRAAGTALACGLVVAFVRFMIHCLKQSS